MSNSHNAVRWVTRTAMVIRSSMTGVQHSEYCAITAAIC